MYSSVHLYDMCLSVHLYLGDVHLCKPFYLGVIAHCTVLCSCAGDSPVWIGVVPGHCGCHPTAQTPEGVPGPLRLRATVGCPVQVQAPALSPINLQHDWLLVAGQDAQGILLADVAQVPAADLKGKSERRVKTSDRRWTRPHGDRNAGWNASDMIFQRSAKWHIVAAVSSFHMNPTLIHSFIHSCSSPSLYCLQGQFTISKSHLKAHVQ